MKKSPKKPTDSIKGPPKSKKKKANHAVVRKGASWFLSGLRGIFLLDDYSCDDPQSGVASDVGRGS